jgi:hypothetical protein
VNFARVCADSYQGMDEQVWVFERGGQPLQIRRRPVTDGWLLEVSGDGAPRSYSFADLDPLITFQSDMERFLLQTGWTFTSFSPDRRTGRERRKWPRLAERRRWWTDGRQPESSIERPRRRR